MHSDFVLYILNELEYLRAKNYFSNYQSKAM